MQHVNDNLPTLEGKSADDLNAIYKAVLSGQTEGESYSRRYRRSVARLRYGPDAPLDLYYKPRNEFISVFGVERYIVSYLRYDFDVSGPKTFKFENREDDIFSAGVPVYVATIPYFIKDDDRWDWYMWMFPTRPAANDAISAALGLEVAHAA